MLAPWAYLAAVTPRTAAEKSYSGRIVSRSFFRLRRLARTPITPEVLTQIKDEVPYEEYPAPFDTHYRYAAVLACPSLSVGELDIPMHSDYVGAEEINFPWKVPLSGISPG